MKKIFMTLMAATMAVTMGSVFVACSNDDDQSPEKTTVKFAPVQKPNFVLSSNGNVLKTTMGTRGEWFPTFKDTAHDTLVTVKDEVEVNLSVADVNNGKKESGAEMGTFQASKLSVHIRKATDVTVFMPIAAKYFSKNKPNDLAVIEVNDKNPGAPGSKDKFVGKYGEDEVTHAVNGNNVTAKVTFGVTENGVEGIKVQITGVTDAVVAYLKETYHDGMTVTVWNYFDTNPQDKEDKITRAGLFGYLNGHATVEFTQKPAIYVNAFAKIPDYSKEVITKDSLNADYNTIWKYPYTVKYVNGTAVADEVLDEEYWVRPVDKNGKPTTEYYLKGHENEFDCAVKAAQFDDAIQVKNDGKSNYNMYYYYKK